MCGHRGTNAECTTNNIDNAWAPLAQWLRCNGRQAFNTETGGGNVASCETFMCEQVAFQKANSDGAPRVLFSLPWLQLMGLRSVLGLRRLGGGQLLRGICAERGPDPERGRELDGPAACCKVHGAQRCSVSQNACAVLYAHWHAQWRTT